MKRIIKNIYIIIIGSLISAIFIYSIDNYSIDLIILNSKKINNRILILFKIKLYDKIFYL